MSKGGKGERYRLYCMLNGMAVSGIGARPFPSAPSSLH